MSNLRAFRFDVPGEALDDLSRRLGATRWPERETPDDWSQGVPLAYMKEVCDYWQNEYDWRRCEAKLNALPQFMAEIDGLDFQFLHVRSPQEDALPLVMTHGWPGSVLEFMKVIGPLSDPAGHGGNASDAFHVVCPTLPGFGFSAKPTAPGWKVERIGRAWGRLMAALGYDRYVAQGGDWGSAVTTSIGLTETDHCAAIHTNMPLVRPSGRLLEDLTDFEQNAIAAGQYYWDWDSGYSKEQSTRPQTVGYGLVDSPVAQAAWIIEKFWAWSDCDGHPENVLTRDELLDNVMMYWLPEAGASSARIYWESFSILSEEPKKVPTPTGVSIYPREIFRASERWVKDRFTKLIHFNILDKGGHFAAFEQPAVFVDEIRTCFAHVR
jgi:epoxide hydrolase